MCKSKTNGFGPKPFSKRTGILDTDGETRALVLPIDAIEPELAEQRAGLNDPRVAVRAQSVDSRLSVGRCKRPEHMSAAPIHAVNFDVVANAEPASDVSSFGRTERNMLAVQRWRRTDER